MLHYDAVPAAVRELLSRLAPLEELSNFHLGGGTSLALRFGHRLSVDLDFFTIHDFDPEALHSALPLTESTAPARAKGSLTLTAGGVKLDFLRHAYPLLSEPERLNNVSFLSARDVVAMKLNAIANRGAKKDFFDLCELLRHHSLEEMLLSYEAKYQNSDRFVVLRSLAWFDCRDGARPRVSQWRLLAFSPKANPKVAAQLVTRASSEWREKRR